MSTPPAENETDQDAPEVGGKPLEPTKDADDIEADPSLSPAAEQGAAALSHIGERKGSELFSDKPVVD